MQQIATTLPVNGVTPERVSRYAWYVVILLMLTQTVSYIDRFLPSLLIQSIKADLQLTDFQVLYGDQKSVV